MNYLKYIEFAAENLQFYLWHRDYTKRFNELPASERALSPEWFTQQASNELGSGHSTNHGNKLKPTAATVEVFKGTDFDTSKPTGEGERFNPFHTPPRTPNNDSTDYPPSMDSRHGSDHQSSFRTLNHVESAENAYREAGLKWQPCM